MADIELSGFTLAKGKLLKGDDYFLYKQIGSITVAVLCDGVGSAEHGGEAAKRVCHYLVNSLKNRPLSWDIQKSIRHFIKSINHILYTESIEQYGRQELITTLTLVVIEANQLYGANVGDSRIYLLRDKNLVQLSQDHIEEGFENDGVLSQAIGISDDVKPYFFENLVEENDNVLLCSDGLYTLVGEESIKKDIHLGARAIVKNASLSVKDNLPDDTTALILHIKEIDHFCLLKQLKLDIPDALKKYQVIDGYKLLEPLAQNQRTWYCQKHGQKYVIKFAPIEAKYDKRILDLFVKEAWNAKRLKAGYFPKAVIPKNRSYRYYIMKMIDGDELKKYLQKRVLSIDEAIKLAKFLLQMSQFLLKYDLVHGDIKPENIIRTTRKDKIVFKMIDFGSILEIFSINSKAGTPSYIAPERFKGESISEKTEIFSIGVTLYESLTGKFPYGEIEPFQTPSFKKPKHPTKLNPKIPNWFESVILRAISIDDKTRYHNYSEMFYELENPQKVKPFYDKNSSIIEREPVKVYKIGFIIMLIINLFLLFKLYL